MKLSLIIPSKSKYDVKLKDLLRSIDEQIFPKEEMETLVITEGTSESAKAIGIRKAKGEIICILASDNVLTYPYFLQHGVSGAEAHYASQPTRYAYRKKDDILTRYFALFGCNDPVPLYLGKNDKLPYYEQLTSMDLKNKTTGDNGYFVQRASILATDMDNYFHIDNSQETVPPTNFFGEIAHNTGGNLFKFLTKRYKYGLQHSSGRRWKMITKRDIPRLLWFIVASLTVVPTTILALRGYLVKRDLAWFLHPVVCLAFLFTYAALTLHLLVRWIFQSLFALSTGQRA